MKRVARKAIKLGANKGVNKYLPRIGNNKKGPGRRHREFEARK